MQGLLSFIMPLPNRYDVIVIDELAGKIGMAWVFKGWIFRLG
jgi:hypothetical protein